MSFVARLKTGQFCVPLHWNARRTKHNEVGDLYVFNNEDYYVVEICTGDLEDYCWIARKE